MYVCMYVCIYIYIYLNRFVFIDCSQSAWSSLIPSDDTLQMRHLLLYQSTCQDLDTDVNNQSP